MHLGENLKKIRKDNNLSQEDLADKLNVSRQSVSKWESGLAYPEMDKVIQICKLFNVNIDDIMNENIDEIKEKKEVKNKFNSYIKNFFDFSSKTVKMFFSMTFKEKIKLLFEEALISFIFFLIGMIIHNVFMSIIYNLFNMHTSNQIINQITYIINNLFENLSLIILIIVFVSLFIHIFKVRYLNYFHIVDDENFDVLKEENEKLNNEQQKILIKDNKKIIIRDAKDSKFSLVNIISKMIRFSLKIFSIFILGFIFFFTIINASMFVLNFLIIKTGVLFLGVLLILLSSLTILLIIFNYLYNFIINRKSKLKLLGTIFITSIIVFGVGIGLSFIGTLSFKEYNLPKKNIKNFDFIYEMDDNLNISKYTNRLKYIEEERIDILVRVKAYKTSQVYSYLTNDNSFISIEVYKNFNSLDDFKMLLNDIKSKKIYNYDYYEVEVHANKENIDKLINNQK